MWPARPCPAQQPPALAVPFHLLGDGAFRMSQVPCALVASGTGHWLPRPTLGRSVPTPGRSSVSASAPTWTSWAPPGCLPSGLGLHIRPHPARGWGTRFCLSHVGQGWGPAGLTVGGPTRPQGLEPGRERCCRLPAGAWGPGRVTWGPLPLSKSRPRRSARCSGLGTAGASPAPQQGCGGNSIGIREGMCEAGPDATLRPVASPFSRQEGSLRRPLPPAPA